VRHRECRVTRKCFVKVSTTIVNVKLTQFIAASLNGLTETGGEAEVIEQDATGSGLSRGGFWDDEE